MQDRRNLIFASGQINGASGQIDQDHRSTGNRVFDGTSATLYLGFSQPDFTEDGQKVYANGRGQIFEVILQ